MDPTTGEKNLCKNCKRENRSEISSVPITYNHDTNESSTRHKSTYWLQHLRADSNSESPAVEMDITCSRAQDPEVYGTYRNQEMMPRRITKYHRNTKKPTLIPANVFLKLYYYPYLKKGAVDKASVKRVLESQSKHSSRKEFFRIVEPSSASRSLRMTRSAHLERAKHRVARLHAKTDQVNRNADIQNRITESLNESTSIQQSGTKSDVLSSSFEFICNVLRKLYI